MISKRERREKHCCKDCIKKHVSCPIAGEVAKYAISCIHKVADSQLVGENHAIHYQR